MTDSKKHLSYSPWAKVGVVWCCLAALLFAEHPLLGEFDWQINPEKLSLAGNERKGCFSVPFPEKKRLC